MMPKAQVLKELTPVTARGEATRRKLLTAAEEEFGGKGFHAASVSSITSRAGVGQGTFYLYFHSKDEVFVTLVRDIGRKLRKQMLGGAVAAADRLEAERESLRGFLEFTQQHPGLYRIVQEAQFVDESVFREFYERLAKGYSEGLSEAVRRGEIAPGDAEARAWALMGIGHFLGMHWCLWQGKMPETQVIDDVMNMVSHGLAQAHA
jgi:AcrR family transcriptional regulator